MIRPICKVCKKRHAAVNYKRGDKIYYRSKCDACIREGRSIKAPRPKWTEAGYKKKDTCDICSFKARWAGQIAVFYVDGNMNNNKLINLKSVCLNCTITIEKQDMPWKRDIDITADI